MLALLTPITLILIVAGAFTLRRAQTSQRAKWLSMILMAAALAAALTQVVLLVREHGRPAAAAAPR